MRMINIKLAPGEQALFDMINAERQKQGVQALQLDPNLVMSARRYALQMMDEGQFSHEATTQGPLNSRVKQFPQGWELMGENLMQQNSPSPQLAHGGFMDSETHKGNVLEPGYNLGGVGQVKGPVNSSNYFVEHFADQPQGQMGGPFPAQVTEVGKRAAILKRATGGSKR
jgi:uncharacterized protein YkwD